MRIALTGDVMLGRLVDEFVFADETRPPAEVWSDVLPLFHSVDRRVINLECVISSCGVEWRPEAKTFHFRARPRAIEALTAARIDAVTLANNHSLDFGPQALLECLQLLDNAGIPHAGAGVNTQAAGSPIFLDAPVGRVAIIAVTDNEPEWEAGDVTPGVNFIEYDDKGLREPYRTRISTAVSEARREADWVVISAHVGPNWGAPAPAIQGLARELVASGVDVYWGHSNHTPQGIEIVGNRVILYSTGDFLDDYAIHPIERNDLSFLFMLDWHTSGIQQIELHPVTIDHLRVRRSTKEEADVLAATMTGRCHAFGTSVTFDQGTGLVNL